MVFPRRFNVEYTWCVCRVFENTSRWLSLNSIIFSACKIGNKSYKIGERFIRKDCSEGCICHVNKGLGIPSCKPVCNNTSPPACPTGQQIEVFDQLVKGTNCFCSQRRCVNRKNVIFVLHQLWVIVLYPSVEAY